MRAMLSSGQSGSFRFRCSCLRKKRLRELIIAYRNCDENKGETYSRALGPLARSPTNFGAFGGLGPKIGCTYLDRAVLLLRQVDLHYLVHVLVEVVLALEALVERLELIIGEANRVVDSLCLVHRIFN